MLIYKKNSQQKKILKASNSMIDIFVSQFDIIYASDSYPPFNIVVVLDQGRIFSYIMDDIEEQEPVNFITFIKSKWDMLIGKYYINIDCSIN